jgi:Domain of unknown function (DUF4390)
MCWRMASRCLSITWLALLLAAPAAYAAETIEIRSPYVTTVSGVYVLNAQLRFEVPEQVERAVRDGATLSLELQIRLSRSRTWWRDEVLAQLEQRYELLYHGVSERYLVRNVNSGAQTSYASLAEAIASLRRVENLPVLDQALLTPDVRNEVSLRASVNVRSIPRVLGLLLFWVDNFSLESDWYTWPMKP